MGESMGVCSHCGSAWFFLDVPCDDSDSTVDAGVTIDSEGEITSYAGQLFCSSCSEPWSPRPRLALVR